MRFCFQARHEGRRKQSHDRRHDARLRIEERLALRVEIRKRDVAGIGRHLGSPRGEERAHPRFGVGVSARRRIGNPVVDLKRARCCRLELARPSRRMPDGVVSSAPSAPMPPALATAIDRLTGQAPAIGASRMGRPRPYCSQNALARSRGRDVVTSCSRCASHAGPSTSRRGSLLPGERHRLAERLLVYRVELDARATGASPRTGFRREHVRMRADERVSARPA